MGRESDKLFFRFGVHAVRYICLHEPERLPTEIDRMGGVIQRSEGVGPDEARKLTLRMVGFLAVLSDCFMEIVDGDASFQDSDYRFRGSHEELMRYYNNPETYGNTMMTFADYIRTLGYEDPIGDMIYSDQYIGVEYGGQKSIL